MAEVFKNNNGVAVTSSVQDLYAAPSGKTVIVLSLRVTNIDGSSADTVTVNVTDSSDTNMAHLASTI